MSSESKDKHLQQESDGGIKNGVYTLENVRLRGYVYKRGTSWQKRWCVLTNSKIIYFKTKTETEPPQGTISLVGAKCSVLEPDDVVKRDFCFTIKSLNKMFYFSCDASKEQAKWVGAVTLSIQTLRVLKDPSIAPHSFKKVSFTRPVFCCSCESFIWGLVQGFMCKSCGVCIHKKCVFKLPDNCKNDSIEKFPNPNIDPNNLIDIQTLSVTELPSNTPPPDDNVQTTSSTTPTTITSTTSTTSTTTTTTTSNNGHISPTPLHNSFLERVDSAPHIRKNEAAHLLAVRKFSDGPRQEPKHFPVVNAAVPYRSNPISFVSPQTPKVQFQAPPSPFKTTATASPHSNHTNTTESNTPHSYFSPLSQIRSTPAFVDEDSNNSNNNPKSQQTSEQQQQQQQQTKTRDHSQENTSNNSLNTNTNATTTTTQPKETENTDSSPIQNFNPRNLPTIIHAPSSPQKRNSHITLHKTVRSSMTLFDTLNVDELKLQLKIMEDKEIKEINDVGAKYEILIHEVMDEFSNRELTEILNVEKDYETRRNEILQEITLRQNLNNGNDSNNGVE